MRATGAEQWRSADRLPVVALKLSPLKAASSFKSYVSFNTPSTDAQRVEFHVSPNG